MSRINCMSKRKRLELKLRNLESNIVNKTDYIALIREDILNYCFPEK